MVLQIIVLPISFNRFFVAGTESDSVACHLSHLLWSVGVQKLNCTLAYRTLRFDLCIWGKQEEVAEG
jgi:hypothetical protein